SMGRPMACRDAHAAQLRAELPATLAEELTVAVVRPHLEVARDGGVCTITLDRPEARNALTTAMRRDLVALAEAIDGDDAVAVAILTGTDPAFSAGVDLKELLGPDRPPQPPRNPAEAIRAVRKPVICAVNGACVTGALEIALSCSFIVASERARFADTHAKVGLVPAWGMSALLPRAVGVRMARELSLSSRFVNADEALRIGLVNHVVAHEELMARTMALARSIAGTNAKAVRAHLDLYRRGDGLPFEDAARLEAETGAAWRIDPEASRAGFAQMTTKGRA
ncbi:MAG: enoyl-CoA hydratase, partial [Candidatus Binatia bacterium]